MLMSGWDPGQLRSIGPGLISHLGHLPTVAIISLKLFSVACTLVGRPGLGLCFIVIVSLLGPCDAIVVANFVTISLSQARIQSQPGHISGRWTFRGCGSPAKVITCYISLFPKAVPLAIIHLLCNIAFWPGSVLVGFWWGLCVCDFRILALQTNGFTNDCNRCP